MVKDFMLVFVMLKDVELLNIILIGKMKMVFVEDALKTVLYVVKQRMKIKPNVKNVQVHMY